MPKRPGLGEYEELLLIALQAVGSGGAYTADVRRALRAVGRPSGTGAGASYLTLRRMEEKGLVRAEMTPARRMKGGRERVRWHITDRGRAALREVAARREQIQGVMAVLT